MKKLFVTSFILLNSVFAIYAQWNGTNPIYTNSEVGINTSTTKGTGLTIGNGDSQAFISPGGADTHLTLSTIGSNGAIRFYTQGGASGLRATTESMRISPLGNVGIGTISPGQKLDVMGNIRFSGGYFIFNTQHSFINWGGSGVGDLTFRTLNTIGNTSSFNDKMIIKFDGNVGIGTTAPGEKLDVSGNIRLNGTHLIYNSQHGVIDWGSSGTGDLYFRTLNTVGNISTYNDKMIIKGNGNVGIGTTAPEDKLEIFNGGLTIGGLYKKFMFNTQFGSSSSNCLLIIPKNNNTWDYSKQFIFYDNGMFKTNGKIESHLDINKNFQISDWEIAGNGGMTLNAFNDNSSSHIPMGFAASQFYFHSGNVGIGTTNTQNYKLAVNGGILCEEIKVIVDVPSADYVFDKDYKLSSLAEIEAFINLHKHLPNIPSAETFKNEGYKIGEMDEMLLRKIEELTLYIIEQNKKIQQLENDIDILKHN